MRKNETLNDPDYRDDMYRLALNQDRIKGNLPLPRKGRPDRSHIIAEGRGELIPASKIKKQNNLPSVSSKSFKLGPSHSHDTQHQYHFFETDNINNERDLINRFRRVSKEFHGRRKLKSTNSW